MKSGPDRGSGPAHDLDREASALLGRTAPLVGALVGARSEELVEQIALAAHDLDAVVARFAGQFGARARSRRWCPSTSRSDARSERVDRRLDRRCADRKRMVGIASRVQDLQQDLAAFVVHGVGDACGVGGRLPSDNHLRGERQQPPGAVGCVPAGDDQADAAAGALREIRRKPVGVAGTVFQPGVHRAHHHAIAQRGEPKVQRRQQVWIRVGHELSFRLAATSSSHSTALSSALIPPRSTRYWCSALPCQRAGVGELPLLETAVGVEQLRPFRAQRRDLVSQCRDVAERGGADLDRQIARPVVGDRTAAARQRFSDPARQLGSARVGHGVDLLVRPALLHDRRRRAPSRRPPSRAACDRSAGGWRPRSSRSTGRNGGPVRSRSRPVRIATPGSRGGAPRRQRMTLPAVLCNLLHCT